MRAGDTLVIHVDKTMPNFATDYTHKKEFPTDRIFDFDEWRFYNNYMSVVKDDENVDLHGNKKCFSMNPNFQLVILATYKSDAELKKLCSLIPHSERMHKIIILGEQTEVGMPGAKKALADLQKKEAFYVRQETGTSDYRQI